jgi:hypothetical protein
VRGLPSLTEGVEDMLKLPTAGLFLACAVTAAPLYPAQSSDPNTTIEIVLRDGKIFDSSKKESAWAASNNFTLRGGERVSLVLKDPNPLLFSLSTVTVSTATEESKAAGDFAKAVAAVLGGFKNKGGGAAAACVIEGVDVGQAIRLLGDIDSHAAPENVTSLLRMSLSAGNSSTLKQAVVAYDVDGLSRRGAELYGKLPAVAAKCLSGSPLAVEDRRVACDLPLFRKNPLDPKDPGACADPNPGTQTVREFVMTTLALQAHVDAATAFLRDLARDVAALDVPATLETRPYSLERQTVTVSVKPVARYEKFFDDGVRQSQKKLLGDHGVVLEPYRPVHVKLVPAFIIGFITNPTFSTVRNGSSFVITRTDSPATAYDVAAMLEITPDKWSEPTFGGHFQVGVSPKKDEVGLYVGAGITIERVVGLGAGFMWRQVHQLGPGLSEGQSLAGPELLKTETRFRPGWYVHLTAQLP